MIDHAGKIPAITVIGAIVADIVVPLGKDSLFPCPDDDRLVWEGDKEFRTPPAEVTDAYLKSLPSKIKARLKITYGGQAFASASVLRELGVDAKLIGAVGDDAPGKGLIQLLKDRDLGVSGIKIVKGVSTTANLIFSNKDTGETAYNLSKEAANEYLEAGDITDEDLDVSLVHFGGIALNPRLIDNNALSRLIRRIRSKKAKIGWDTVVDIYGKERSLPVLTSMCEADYLTPSIKEARKITGEQGVEENLAFFKRLGAKAVFLKNGENGSEIYTTEESVFGVAAREHVPAVRDIIFLESTGAGDSYSAYIAYAVAAGLPPVDAARGAAVCGALTCERVGGGSIGPDPAAAFRDKMKSYLRQLS